MNFSKLLGSAAILALALPCCTFLPSAGPSGYRIHKEAGRTSSRGLTYQLLKVDESTVSTLEQHSPSPSYQAAGGRDVMKLFQNRGIERLGQGSAQAIQPGDFIHIAIFESGGGLFSAVNPESGGGGTPVTSLPPQQVNQVGDITIPYVGRIRALGRLPGDLETEIQSLLKGKTVEPQAIVTVMKREGGNLVSVGGDVKTSGQIPVTLAGTRLIDAISAAGGPTTRPHQVMVSVTRNGVTRSDTLQSIFDTPNKNILLQPSDTVLLRNVTIGYMVFGAGGLVGQQPIDTEDFTLAQAMARTGGANDMRANPAAVFIYRQESRSIVDALGHTSLSSGGTTVPVIYQFEMQKPESFFYASNFQIRDRDIIYYANATSVGVGKFVGLLNTMLSPVASVAGGASMVKILSPGTL